MEPCSDVIVHIFLCESNLLDMRLKEMCSDEMPREKLMNKGPEALSNVELLAILLRTGRGGANVIDVAREILQGAEERLSNLSLMNISNLCRINGVGPGKAVALAAAFERPREYGAIHQRRYSHGWEADNVGFGDDVFGKFNLAYCFA